MIDSTRYNERHRDPFLNSLKGSYNMHTPDIFKSNFASETDPKLTQAAGQA